MCDVLWCPSESNFVLHLLHLLWLRCALMVFIIQVDVLTPLLRQGKLERKLFDLNILKIGLILNLQTLPLFFFQILRPNVVFTKQVSKNGVGGLCK